MYISRNFHKAVTPLALGPIEKEIAWAILLHQIHQISHILDTP